VTTKSKRSPAAKKAETNYYERTRAGHARLPGAYLDDDEAAVMDALYQAHGGGKKQAILDAAAEFVKNNQLLP